MEINSKTSMRPLVHSYGQPLWTNVGLSTTGKKGPQHDFVSRSTAASTNCDVQVHAADPTGLVAAVRGDSPEMHMLNN